jgi:hypothetical protein
LSNIGDEEGQAAHEHVRQAQAVCGYTEYLTFNDLKTTKAAAALGRKGGTITTTHSQEVSAFLQRLNSFQESFDQRVSLLT